MAWFRNLVKPLREFGETLSDAAHHRFPTPLGPYEAGGFITENGASLVRILMLYHNLLILHVGADGSRIEYQHVWESSKVRVREISVPTGRKDASGEPTFEKGRTRFIMLVELQQMLCSQPCEEGGSSLASALLPLFRAHEANKNEFRGAGTHNHEQPIRLEGGRLVRNI